MSALTKVTSNDNMSMTYQFSQDVIKDDLYDELLNTFQEGTYELRSHIESKAKFNSLAYNNTDDLISDIQQRISDIESIDGYKDNPDLESQLKNLDSLVTGLTEIKSLRNGNSEPRQIFALLEKGTLFKDLAAAYTEHTEFLESCSNPVSGMPPKLINAYNDLLKPNSSESATTDNCSYQVTFDDTDLFKNLLFRPSSTGNDGLDLNNYKDGFGLQFGSIVDAGKLYKLRSQIHDRMSWIEKQPNGSTNNVLKNEYEQLRKIDKELESIQQNIADWSKMTLPERNTKIQTIANLFEPLSKEMSVIDNVLFNRESGSDQTKATELIRTYYPKYNPLDKLDFDYTEIEIMIFRVLVERSQVTTAYVNMMYKNIQDNNKWIAAQNERVARISAYKTGALDEVTKKHVTQLKDKLVNDDSIDSFTLGQIKDIAQGTQVGNAPTTPEQQAAAQYLLDNPEFSSLLNTAAQGGKTDEYMSEADFASFLEKAPSEEQKTKADAEIKALQSKIEEINNIQQLAMIKLQKGGMTVNECIDMISTVTKKCADIRSGIIHNMG